MVLTFTKIIIIIMWILAERAFGFDEEEDKSRV